MRFIYFLLLALLFPLAYAAGYDYSVEIEAPSEVSSLLRSHLSLIKAQGDARTSAAQVRRLVDACADETKELLATQGYFSPTIRVRYQPEISSTVYLEAIPGTPTKVGKVHLRLSGAAASAPDAAALQQGIAEAWPLPMGTIFTQSLWADAKNHVLDLLYKRWYAGATITRSDALVDPNTSSATLTIEIDSGPAYRFGAITIKGLKHYPESLARAQAPFKPGDVYRRSDLVDLQANLQAQPHFSLALIDTQLSSTDPYEAPVTIDIQEAPRHRIQTGVGYTTNTGMNAELGYRFLNLAGRGWITETKTRIAKSEQSIDTAITFPRTSKDYEHRIYTGFVHTELQGLDTRTWRHGIARELGDFKLSRTVGLEYQTERRTLNDGQTDNPNSLALKFQWIRRDLDNPRDPHSGRMTQLESGAALANTISTETFIRAYGRHYEYWPITRKSTLLARVELGQTFARDETEVPTDWLFRTGGSSSVRGYDYQSLGVEKGGAISPGRVLAVASLETQWHVWNQWRAAMFVDSGDAALRWAELNSKTGAGMGARWSSQAGVFGADWAYGLAQKKWRFHLALGLAF